MTGLVLFVIIGGVLLSLGVLGNGKRK